MSWQDPRLWALLTSIEGVGPKTFSNILGVIRDRGLTAEEFWRSPGQVLTDFSLMIQKNSELLQKEYSLADYWEWLQQKQIEVITENSEEYPSLLRQIPDKPPVLFAKGKFRSWNTLPVAVVGTRHATMYGRLATEKIVSELVGLGSTIISGFMYGIDLLAHQAAVKSGGATVGVLGYGFDYIFPRSQERIFQEMLEQGHTFITEYSPSTRPAKGTFVSRNRIVAGLARGVIVVEAAERSGSLITAQAALEYNREVMAVPGPINSIYSQGTVALINQGATLVTSGKHVWEALGVSSQESGRFAEILLDDAFQHHIYNQLKMAPQTEEQLHLILGQPIAEVLTALSMMEVAGWLKRTGDVWAINV